ncbi:neurofilament medium polypeptide-like protein [Lasius niger]|uniref:Neurofilament medium polypeptide-like protein n=1 Tax=Lasius niger TaxID=67767 RepID=A0A0J7KMB6_LASNI|nr:neurofilament medium polypeptide-like protein [Lasius niger]
MGDWKNHFQHLLEGSEKDKKEDVERRSLNEDQEEELRDEEIEKQIKKLKRKKAVGADGLGSEVWLYSEGQIREKLKELCKLV